MGSYIMRDVRLPAVAVSTVAVACVEKLFVVRSCCACVNRAAIVRTGTKGPRTFMCPLYSTASIYISAKSSQMKSIPRTMSDLALLL